uniref:Cytochrome b6-f complex subunit VII n=1 Tax=Astrosyne radiata TaxID=1158023 RepID=A0A2U9NTC8_9STRA|nr:cytochrome b6-f complex subunit VII [Astrosyne radiata]AWT40282.1 cytochrome b6-f complex subunit VII [Astrosyne radiata]
MQFLLTIFPYANKEIVFVTLVCLFMTLFGLSLGFILLKVQGE